MPGPGRGHIESATSVPGLSVQDEQKRRAARRAVELVENGMRLGLGTGSTARHVLDALAERRGQGELPDVLGVPTSRATAELGRQLGIPLSTLDETPTLDLTIDGADEVDPDLDVIKGLGGALLWEKIVARASRRFAIVVDESKLVGRLGERGPLPVEVVPFGWRTHLSFLISLGAEPELRLDGAGKPFTTDGGHYILHCRFPGGIADPNAVETALARRAGVVESGLFLDMVDTVVVGTDTGAHLLRRGESG